MVVGFDDHLNTKSGASDILASACPEKEEVLFVTQCFDGSQAGSAPGGVKAEDEANGGSESGCKQHGQGIDDQFEIQSFGGGQGHEHAEDNAQETAQQAEGDRFEQELGQDVPFERADGLADADLAGALGDADQHDVHDADAADKQGDGGDCAEEGGQRAGDGVDGVQQFGLAEGAEVVLVASGDIVLRSQGFGDLVDSCLGLGFVHSLGVMAADCGLAVAGAVGVEAALSRRHRNIDVFIRIADQTAALAFQHADDFVFDAVDLDRFADRVLIAEQLGERHRRRARPRGPCCPHHSARCCRLPGNHPDY